MAKYRFINGVVIDVNFTGTRLINGSWIAGQPESSIIKLLKHYYHMMMG